LDLLSYIIDALHLKDRGHKRPNVINFVRLIAEAQLVAVRGRPCVKDSVRRVTWLSIPGSARRLLL